MQYYKCIFGSPRFCVKLSTGNARYTQHTDKTKDSTIIIGLACMCTWTSTHTKLMGQMVLAQVFLGPAEKPSGFQSPLAPLYRLLRVFLLKQPASYCRLSTNIQMTYRSTGYKCLQFHLIFISSVMSADFRLSEGMSYFRRDLKYCLFL